MLRINGPAKARRRVARPERQLGVGARPGDIRTNATIEAQLAGNPERTVSRLLSSRVLQPDTQYLACVVPTFDLGCKAGLGRDITADDEAKLRSGVEAGCSERRASGLLFVAVRDRRRW